MKNNTDSDNQRNLQMVQQFLQLLEQEELYKDPNLTLDLMAKQMGINRVYLSRSINRCIDKNFNSVINGYRIKDALRIIDADGTLSIMQVAFDVGFNDRKTFYRVFKSMMGMSPSDYMKAKHSILIY